VGYDGSACSFGDGCDLVGRIARCDQLGANGNMVAPFSEMDGNVSACSMVLSPSLTTLGHFIQQNDFLSRLLWAAMRGIYHAMGCLAIGSLTLFQKCTNALLRVGTLC